MPIAAPTNAIATGQLPAATPTDTPTNTPTNTPTDTPIDTEQLPIRLITTTRPTTTGPRHTFANPNAVSVAQLGATRSLRGPRAHSAAAVGSRGWRVKP